MRPRRTTGAAGDPGPERGLPARAATPPRPGARTIDAAPADGPVTTGSAAIVDRPGLDSLIRALAERGYAVTGPVVRDGAVVHAPVAGTDDLPVGYRDRQGPGSYRVEQAGDDALFAWAVGPASWKASFFPPRETLWRAAAHDDEVTVEETPQAAAPVAVFGARPCEIAAMAVLDRVLGEGAVPDASYARRRSGTFVVAAECGHPAATCFCTSMGTGPGADGGYDLALCELPAESAGTAPDGGGGRRYVVSVGSALGAAVLAEVPHQAATAHDLERRHAVVAGATASMTRALDTDGLPELLARNIDHPRWEETAQRCLSCGNCTLVCPTCFCSDVHDVSDLGGTVERQRSWSSCFDRAHSFIHGGPVRPTTASCYRQWLTHKLSTWWDQFGSSGCVGCGRCITWCPVGIDITEEAAAIRSSDGATPGGGGA
ncbi:MAG TPA: 4Fe-4S dicluster domain-containing protein [Acidimicrobiales bacterium]|nr:4Fe-4S dicluster domain-containing protein [Acidimicrobiales bacterium]